MLPRFLSTIEHWWTLCRTSFFSSCLLYQVDISTQKKPINVGHLLSQVPPLHLLKHVILTVFECQLTIWLRCEPAVRKLIFKDRIKLIISSVLKYLSAQGGVNKCPQAWLMFAIVRRKMIYLLKHKPEPRWPLPGWHNSLDWWWWDTCRLWWLWFLLRQGSSTSRSSKRMRGSASETWGIQGRT